MKKKLLYLSLLIISVSLLTFILKTSFKNPDKNEDTEQMTPLSPSISTFKYGKHFTFSSGGGRDSDLIFSIGKDNINYLISRQSVDFEKEIYWYRSNKNMKQLQNQDIDSNNQDLFLLPMRISNIFISPADDTGKIRSGEGIVTNNGRFLDFLSIFNGKIELTSLSLTHSIEKNRDFFITFNDNEENIDLVQEVFVCDQDGHILQKKDIASFYQENLGLSFESALNYYLEEQEKQIKQDRKQNSKYVNWDIYTDNRYL